MARALRAVACAIVLAGCGETKADDPRLDSSLGFALYLPVRMQQALDSAAPGFRLTRAMEYRADVREAATEEGGGTAQALFAVVGDFDGDGAQDVAVEGTTNDSSLVVMAILNTGSKPKVFEVARFPSYDASTVGVYLSRPVRPGLGAFAVVNYPDESTLYFYRDGKFQGMPTSG